MAQEQKWGWGGKDDKAKKDKFGFVSLKAISTFMDYLMPKPSLWTGITTGAATQIVDPQQRGKTSTFQPKEEMTRLRH